MVFWLLEGWSATALQTQTAKGKAMRNSAFGAALGVAAVLLAAPAMAQENWLDFKDPSLTQRPRLDMQRSDIPTFPLDAFRKRHTGQSVVVLCVSEQGRPVNPELTARAENESLNTAALDHAKSSVFIPGKVGDKTVPVCGYHAVYDWKLPEQE